MPPRDTKEVTWDAKPELVKRIREGFSWGHVFFPADSHYSQLASGFPFTCLAKILTWAWSSGSPVLWGLVIFHSPHKVLCSVTVRLAVYTSQTSLSWFPCLGLCVCSGRQLRQRWHLWWALKHNGHGGRQCKGRCSTTREYICQVYSLKHAGPNILVYSINQNTCDWSFL